MIQNLHVNKTNFHMKTWTHFETEVEGNLEIAYLHTTQHKQKQRFQSFCQLSHWLH